MKLKFIEQVGKETNEDEAATDVVANVEAFSGLKNEAFWVMPPLKDGEAIKENDDKATFVKCENGVIAAAGIVQRSNSLGALVKAWAHETFVTCKRVAGDEDVKVLFRVKDRVNGGMAIRAIYDNAATIVRELLIVPVSPYC